MKITKDLVNYTAQLARMGISDEEAEALSSELAKILDYIDKLNRLDTSRVEPTSHILDIKNVFREDRLRPSLGVDDALQNAPSRKGDFFKVPRIV